MTTPDDRLRASGLKATATRRAVLHALEEHPHSGVDEVLARVRVELPDTSAQAVYGVLSAFTDAGLARRSGDERRVLLTRDRRLLHRRALAAGALVRSGKVAEQLTDVLDRFAPPLQPWTRCMACGAALRPAGHDEVAEELRPHLAHEGKRERHMGEERRNGEQAGIAVEPLPEGRQHGGDLDRLGMRDDIGRAKMRALVVFPHPRGPENR